MGSLSSCAAGSVTARTYFAGPALCSSTAAQSCGVRDGPLPAQVRQAADKPAQHIGEQLDWLPQLRDGDRRRVTATCDLLCAGRGIGEPLAASARCSCFSTSPSTARCMSWVKVGPLAPEGAAVKVSSASSTFGPGLD